MFYKHSNEDKVAILIVYVDDIVLTRDDCNELEKLKGKLAEEFEIKDLGALKYFLGMEFARSKEGIFVNQWKYVLDLLDETGMLGCKLAETPIELNVKLQPKKAKNVKDRDRYQRLVGRLIYLSHTCLDIAFSVSMVSQFMHAPGPEHFEAVYRILRYLKGTPGGNLVTWRSKKQNVVARSSAEVEFRAVTHGICEIMWIRRLLEELKMTGSSPMKLYCDNKAVISVAYNPVLHDRTKHVEVDKHFIKEKIDNGLVCMTYIPTEEQVADVFTKGLHKRQFDFLCLCVNLAERSKFSEGEIQTFMSVDADRIVNLCNSFHDMWSLPLQIGLALYLLYTQVKFAFVSGIAITILLIPVNKWISKFIARATEKMMKKKDERISKTAEILAYIRTLKMYGWELLFMSWLMEIRSSEVKHLSTRKYLDAWCVFFWATTPTLFSLFTFGLFTLMGYQLDAAMVFTCLALFNTLISPLNSFPWVINGLIDAIISTRRLSRFLSCSEHKPAELEQTAGSPSSPSFSGQFNFKLEDMAVAMYDASCAWSSSEEVEKDLVLHHVTLGLPRGSLVAIIGEVGSGKSSLLNSILKEMRLIHGSIYSDGSITYVPQVPWILSGTIRENILFGKAYDPTRYSDVLEACALDIDISLMVGGDMAYIGDKGVNLSGGQRARLALARAIYHGSDIFMLDDVLSAVDTQVARCILHNAILGPLMNQHTRVLCTHNIQAMSSADMIVVMDKGHVKWVGSSTDFSVSSYSTFCSLNEFTVSQVRSLECSTNTSTETKQDCKPERDSICVPGEAQEIIEVELRKEGRVELTVYNYATYSGWFITVVICLSAILMQASRNGNDLWLSYWVDTTTGSSHTEYSTSFYLVVLCIFCVINSFLTLVRAFSFAFGGLRAAVQVHNTLLSKLINAPVHFFDKTPGGRILNRMSSDLYTIDDSLPFILNILLANIVGLLGIAIVLSYVQVVFLLLLLPFWYVYSKIQFYYRSTSRELRRLDSVSRSPIFASFTETLDGSSTIRAFKCEDLFFTRFSEHVALYQQTSYSELIASLWLSLRLQLLAALVISFVAMMAVIGSRDSLPISLGTPGLVGLALSYAAPIVSLLGSFLTSFTETEKEMVSVERVLQYMDIPQEELNGCQSLSPNWPSEGYIMFQNVSLRYLPSLPDALHDITFTISGGTQVGIIGRTGAGKSSILNALFRLTPICKGCILVDGLDIADVPVRDLRSHFAVVPQSPFLFEGSLRDNLDPFRVSDDLKIWKTLERCHVKEEVEVAGGLDIHVKESGTSFSVGQRQLLCLARALLKSSKVLCLDECTANIDAQTSSVLQNAILTECRGMTVITIAHRISTVLSMDNILILDRGILMLEISWVGL
uniref:ABC-type xenobiotic transporter n=1 Tax=Vitis vinifera TaxID=29760 RepID=F6HBQ8_VITVI